MARIVHFHGPKPTAAGKLIRDETYRQDDPMFQSWRNLFFQNQEGYRLYVDRWNSFRAA